MENCCINEAAVEIALTVAGLKSGRLLSGLKPD